MQSSFGMPLAEAVTRRPRRLKLQLFSLAVLWASLFLGVIGPVTLLQAAPVALPGVPVSTGSASPFGMNVQGGRCNSAACPNDNFNLPFNTAQGLGIGWTREEFGWHRIEPRPGQWNFGGADAIVAAASSRNIQVMALLDYNVDRSSGDAKVSFTMPNLTAWGTYVRQMVTRYKDRGVRHWQIWNEPQDRTYFDSSNSEADYARLLSTSYDIIKSIDPGATVITAGFVPVDNGVDWMERMLDAGGRNKFDVVSVHPYVNDPTPLRGGSMSPERAYWSTTDLNQAQNFASKIGKRVWASEFGWSLVNTDPAKGRFNAVSAEQQANYLTRAYVMGLNSQVEKFFVYQLHDDNLTATDRYGLVGTDWSTQKPSYGAYKNMVTRLNGATPQGRVDPYEGTSNHANIFDFNSASGGVSCANGGPGGNGPLGCFASSFADANAEVTSERARSGQSFKINYNFKSGANDRYVTFYPPAFPAVNFNATRLGFWAYGDASRTQLIVGVTDNNGQRLTYAVGRAGAPSGGWQRYEAQLAFPLESGRQIAFPIKNFEILLDGWPKNANYSGTIFIDDVYVENSPPVYMYRYTKGDKTLDVLWADADNATVSLPTTSTQATVYERNGSSRSVSASNGQLSLAVSDAPIYVEYSAGTPPATPTPQPPNPTPGVPTPVDPNCSGPGDAGLRNAYQPTWERFDAVVGTVSRSWMWGPTTFRYVKEVYDEAPGKCRSVLYWDKSRMEITNPNGNRADKYFVTNGLLARELISGQMQLGDNRVVAMAQGPAQIATAGDSAGNPNAPTYASFARVTSLKNDNRQPNRGPALVIETLDKTGNIGTNTALSQYSVRLTNFVAITGHNTADVFWQFMNSRGPIKIGGAILEGDAVDWVYSIGYPLSEPYWARVTVAGQEKDVLIQVFERRVLTYTPSNPAGFKVEMGNIGQHYATWRYGQAAG